MLLEKEHTLNFTGFSEIAVQKSFFQTAFHHQLPVAAWRLPNQEQQHVIIDLSGAARQVPLELESLTSGFVVSPFTNQTNPLQASLIRADLHYCSTSTLAKGRPPTRLNPSLRQVKPNTEHLLQTVQYYLKNNNTETSKYHLPLHTDVFENTRKAAFIALVEQAIKAIEEDQFQKVVPSRRKMVSLPNNFEIVDTFHKLCQGYPAAFVSVFSIPGIGTWIGASPEILVSTFLQEKTKIFRTIALAGTQVKKENCSLRETAWRQKEIEEQALVSRYIISCFKKIRLREYEEKGPKTVAAGNLIHLRTDFTVDTLATNFPELASIMLRLLHPTSAVCGMPKEPTMHFLRQREGYDREYFSGFMGPVNMSPDELHIFVNLRCMQLLDKQAVLYSGAGVTIDSNPTREWKETEAKMNTLLKVIAE